MTKVIAKPNRLDLKIIMAAKKALAQSHQNLPHSSKVTTIPWTRIAKQIGESALRCRSRWKTLRNTFRRHASRKGTGEIKSDWPYYEHMLFLHNYLSTAGSSTTSNTSVKERDEESPQQTADEEMEETEELSEPEPAEEPHVMPQVPAPIVRSISVESITKEEPQIVRMDKVRYVPETNATTAVVDPFVPTANLPSPALYGRPAATNEGTGPEEYEEPPLSWRTIDTDEQFLLSCLTAMKRLSRRRNALVRLQIQQLMYEAEFADEDEARNASYNNR
ncbi:uncharacterized protein LOC118513741 [Anopheles stephensi]|uniref:uncharacterized protein LOC118513741 n=1 Tax=Anopheles stephensi TaxID=30069 RepID=UPI0016588412|nr:uncharacterized protein LOC118513741 [Anopheles stephensi]